MTAHTHEEGAKEEGGSGLGDYWSPSTEAPKQDTGQPRKSNVPWQNGPVTQRARRPDGSGDDLPRACPTQSPALDPQSPVTMATVMAAARPRSEHVGQACLHGGRDAAESGSMRSGAVEGCGGSEDDQEPQDDEFGTFVAAGNRVEWDEFGISAGEGCLDGESDSLLPERRADSVNPGDGWRAFADEEDTSRGPTPTNACAKAHSRSPDKGQWWFGDHTGQQRPKASFTEQSKSTQHKVLQIPLSRIFESCFPPQSLTASQEEVQPLEGLLCSQANTCAGVPHMRQAAHLFESLIDRKHAFDLRIKWSGSHSQKACLASLHIDPTRTKIPTRPKPLVDSPIIAKKMEGRKLLVSSSGYDRELKLTKVTDASVPVNGFSPSHHLQSFLQQWMQSSGKKKLKMAYDFNRSLLV
ncbi:aftiphilin-like isoform X2 [Ambystoma mexicanum]|uniref:aftiphilin-like isoform X2 n=1 Tax=Ambystoma mexicanum TaxID=8296 RepID=UPI0037E712A1